MTVWHLSFAKKLNVVVIHKTNISNGKTAHVVLFSSDLELNWEKLIEYYRLRFQIEFNFRDAKQYWGLEDLMNVNQQQIYNGVNLSLFMINLSSQLCQKPLFKGMGVLDLKSWFRANKYVQRTLNIIPEFSGHIFNQNINDIAALGRINPPSFVS